MKILVFPVLFIFLLASLYLFKYKPKNKKQKNRLRKEIWLGVALAIILLIGVLGVKFLDSINAPDTQCTKPHITSTVSPKALLSADDYFNQGNYDYDIGNCKQAIIDYSKAIELNPSFSEAYNNRAYTYMRMQAYEKALPDLNKALILRPNYIRALMNHGDLHNYYGPIIDKKIAIADYEKVISLGGTKGASVCGHLFLAKHNGWNLGTILDFPREALSVCK